MEPSLDIIEKGTEAVCDFLKQKGRMLFKGVVTHSIVSRTVFPPPLVFSESGSPKRLHRTRSRSFIVTSPPSSMTNLMEPQEEIPITRARAGSLSPGQKQRRSHSAPKFVR